MPLGLLAVGSVLTPNYGDGARADRAPPAWMSRLPPASNGQQRELPPCEVVVIDARLEADPHAALVAAADGALCVGMSVLTGAPILDALAAAQAVKARYPRLPVIWGGWHPSLFPTECLDDSAVDITVQAQGEATFADLVARLSAGESTHGCSGCAWRDEEGTVYVESPRAIQDLNTLPPHDYSLLAVERYFAYKGRRQLDYVTSQGCYFRCAFCADPFVFQRQWSGLAPERVVAELADLWRRYQFEDVAFQDETFFTRPARVAAIAEGLLVAGVRTTWCATMRADQGWRLPEETLALCRRSGLRRLLVGVESGSQAMLDWMKKDIRLEQVLEVAEKCQRHGLEVDFPFIVGFPDESDESVQATLDLVMRLRAMSPHFHTPIFYFRPYPGSPITQAAVAAGFQLPRTLQEWSSFDMYTGGGPWVGPERYRHIERFKYYQEIAWSPPKTWKRPLQALARWRCRHDRYELPADKLLRDALVQHRPRTAEP